MLFTSLPYDKAMPWLECKAFETLMGVNSVVLCEPISNARVTFKRTFNVIKESTKYIFTNRSRIQIQEEFQCKIVSGS